MRTSLLVIALTAVALAATFALTAPAGTQRTAAKAPVGIHKIEHVVVIMQENRSFDHYFGMYPGADGYTLDGSGQPTNCVPDPRNGGCVKPYHDPDDIDYGGPHGAAPAAADINNGLMDGFIASWQKACPHSSG